MHLSDSDLKQLDAERVARLTAPQKDTLLFRLLEDLKEARERLRANSQNSSKPPSSDPPWKVGGDPGIVEETTDSKESTKSGQEGSEPSQGIRKARSGERGRPEEAGPPPGSRGA